MSLPITLKAEALPGVKLLSSQVFEDARGSFLKTFHAPSFECLGIEFQPVEQFFSRSVKGVLRGMHFQTGASAQDKLVYCLAGRVLDVVVDVRPQSPQFNQPFSQELRGDDGLALFIPKGYAHGFLSLEEDSLMGYQTSTVHDPLHDVGVLWSSINFDWPVVEPQLSTRDRSHPPIQDCDRFWDL